MHNTVYQLVLQDAARDLRLVAILESMTPFPKFVKGDTVEVNTTDPLVWDIVLEPHCIIEQDNRKNELRIRTVLVVDSPCHRPDGPHNRESP